jgi:hypothetical protein
MTSFERPSSVPCLGLEGAAEPLLEPREISPGARRLEPGRSRRSLPDRFEALREARGAGRQALGSVLHDGLEPVLDGPAAAKDRLGEVGPDGGDAFGDLAALPGDVRYDSGRRIGELGAERFPARPQLAGDRAAAAPIWSRTSTPWVTIISPSDRPASSIPVRAVAAPDRMASATLAARCGELGACFLALFPDPRDDLAPDPVEGGLGRRPAVDDLGHEPGARFGDPRPHVAAPRASSSTSARPMRSKASRAASPWPLDLGQQARCRFSAMPVRTSPPRAAISATSARPVCSKASRAASPVFPISHDEPAT